MKSESKIALLISTSDVLKFDYCEQKVYGLIGLLWSVW